MSLGSHTATDAPADGDTSVLNYFGDSADALTHAHIQPDRLDSHFFAAGNSSGTKSRGHSPILTASLTAPPPQLGSSNSSSLAHSHSRLQTQSHPNSHSHSHSHSHSNSNSNSNSQSTPLSQPGQSGSQSLSQSTASKPQLYPQGTPKADADKAHNPKRPTETPTPFPATATRVKFLDSLAGLPAREALRMQGVHRRTSVSAFVPATESTNQTQPTLQPSTESSSGAHTQSDCTRQTETQSTSKAPMQTHAVDAHSHSFNIGSVSPIEGTSHRDASGTSFQFSDSLQSEGMRRTLAAMQKEVERVSANLSRPIAERRGERNQVPSRHINPLSGFEHSYLNGQHISYHDASQKTSAEKILENIQRQMEEYNRGVESMRQSMNVMLDQRLIQWEREVTESIINPQIKSSLHGYEQKIENQIPDFCITYCDKIVSELIEKHVPTIVKSVLTHILPNYIAEIVPVIADECSQKTVHNMKQSKLYCNCDCHNQETHKQSKNLNRSTQTKPPRFIAHHTPTQVHHETPWMDSALSKSYAEAPRQATEPNSVSAQYELAQRLQQKLLEKAERLAVMQNEALKTGDCKGPIHVVGKAHSSFTTAQPATHSRNQQTFSGHSESTSEPGNNLLQHPLNELEDCSSGQQSTTRHTQNEINVARRFNAYKGFYRDSLNQIFDKKPELRILSAPVAMTQGSGLGSDDDRLILRQISNLASQTKSLNDSDRFVHILKAVYQQFPNTRHAGYFPQLRLLVKEAIAEHS